MPAVPTVVVPSVSPTPSSGVPYQNASGATPAAFGGDIAVAEQGLAKQLEQTGDVLAKHALKMQDEVNASTAKDLFLAGDVDIGKLTVEYNSLQGANKVNALPKYYEDVAAIREKYKQAAPNTDVARRFDQDFARRVGYSIVDAARGAATANKQYQNDTNKAVQANALGHIAANAKDDNRFETELGIGLETVKSADDYKGSSPEVQKQHEEAFRSGAWATRLQAMAKTEPLRARELFTKNKDALDGVTQLKLEDNINQQIVNVQSRIDADRIVQSGAFTDKSLEERVKKFEGYRKDPYGDYKQISSGYGTKYQSGDENIPPDQLKIIHEQRLKSELGRAATIVDNFAPGLPKGTRDALIDLTYNAGQSWTTGGLGAAVRAGDDERAKDIYGQYIKAGGVDHEGLKARRGAFIATWGGEARESAPADQMGTALDRAKEQAIKVFPNDEANQAKYLDTLQNRIKTDYNVLQSSARQMQLDLRNTVQSELFRQEAPPKSYDELSPKAQQAYDQAPPALQQSFQRSFKQNATADVPLTPERQSRFDALRGEATLPSTVDKFMSRDLSSVDLPRTQLSMLKKMQDDRKALLEKGSKMAPYMNSMRADLNDLQINESRTETARNEEFLKFRGVYEAELSRFAEEKKRPANEQEGREIGKKLLKDIVTSPGFLWGNYTDRAYRVIADKTPIQLRADDPQAHYAELPRGATYIGPDGQTRVKP